MTKPPQRAKPPIEKLRAFVRGELDEAQRREMEEWLDTDPEARGLLGLLAREADDTRGGKNRDPYIGMRLSGRYHIQSALGEGGMGSVYEAEHLQLGRRVALKLLKPEYARHVEVCRRFENEARAAAALDHPHIVRALDVGRTEDGIPFIVFELLRGESLAARLKGKGSLDVRDVVKFGGQLADALTTAHAEGIIHRDIKPANIVVVDDDAKLIDFGISKVRSDVETRTGAFMGTPAYMSPEQLRDASRVDDKADVYSLCAVLFMALRGKPPHAEVSGLGALMAARQNERPSLDERPDIPDGLRATIERGLSPKSEERPSAKELSQTLAAFAPAPDRTAASDRRIVAALHMRGMDETRFSKGVSSTARLLSPSCAVFGEDSWHRATLRDAASIATELATDESLLVLGTGRLDVERESLSDDASSLVESAFVAGLRGAHATADAMAMLGVPRREGSVAGLFPIFAKEEESLSTLVGRRVERVQCVDLIERFVEERESMALVFEGPPGIGKTRLLDAAFSEARRRHALCIELGARPPGHGAANSYELLRDFVAALMASAPEIFAEPNHPDEQALRRFVEGDELGEVHSTALGDRIRLSALQLARRVSAAQDIIVFVENLQWASSTLRTFLENLVDSSGPLLLFATSREEGVLSGANIRTLVLQGLRRSDVRFLAEEVSGRPIDDGDLDSLYARTEGNPFFIEQLMGETDEAQEALPLNIEAAVQARLDAFPTAEQALVRVLSVCGDHAFDETLLSSIAENEWRAPLDSLRRRGLIRNGRSSGTYQFGSAIVAEAARSSLDTERRRALHRRIAAHLMRASTPNARRIAHHLEGAGDESAESWYRRATLHAAKLGEHDAVIELAAKASERTKGDDEIISALAEAFELSGRFAEEEAALRRALTLDGDTDAHAEYSGRLAVSRLRQGHVEEALSLFGEVNLEGVTPATEARFLGKRAVACAYTGAVGDAVDFIGRVERLVMVHVPELRAEVAQWRGQIAAATGDLADRRNSYWAAVELFSERGDLRRRAGAAVNLADVYNRLGAYGEATRALRAALVDCQALRLRHAEAYARANLAYALIQQGQGSAAASELEVASELGNVLSDTRLLITLRLYAIRAAEVDGEPPPGLADDAREVAKEAQSAGVPAVATLAFAAESRIRRRAGTDGLPASTEAMELLRVLGSIEEDEAEVALAHAQALEAAGKEAEAARVRAEAAAVIEAQARRIGEPIWREAYRADVPAHASLLPQ